MVVVCEHNFGFVQVMSLVQRELNHSHGQAHKLSFHREKDRNTCLFAPLRQLCGAVFEHLR
jgi:hypothetical protein